MVSSSRVADGAATGLQEADRRVQNLYPI